MRRVLGLAVLVSVLAGCGGVGAGAAGASAAAAAADEAAQAKKMEARVPQQVQAAEDAAAQQRSEAEKQLQ
jgi:outer membrane lipoprotein-sorting protein